VTNRAVLVLTVAVAVVGAIDAAVSIEWDLFVVFVLVGLLQLVLLLRLSGRRPTVPVRADLVRWLRDRAAAEGESTERIVDRAVSAYRDGLVGEASGSAGHAGPTER
jgi:ABC-type multidrug transport system fused ATPase/permease subunit